MKASTWWVLLALFSLSCAGVSRQCSGCWAKTAGADWIVVQMDMLGRPVRSWRLHGVSVANEENSDGIYWKSNGHMVHVAIPHVRVQVHGKQWAQAYEELLGTSAGTIPPEEKPTRVRPVLPPEAFKSLMKERTSKEK